MGEYDFARGLRIAVVDAIGLHDETVNVVLCEHYWFCATSRGLEARGSG